MLASILRQVRTLPRSIVIASASVVVSAGIVTGRGVALDADRHLARNDVGAIQRWFDVGFPIGAREFAVVDDKAAAAIANDSKLLAPPGIDVDSFRVRSTAKRISWSSGRTRYAAPGVAIATVAWLRVAPNAPLGPALLRLEVPHVGDASALATYNRSADLQAVLGLWTTSNESADDAVASLATIVVHSTRTAALATLAMRGLLRFTLMTLFGALGIALALWVRR